MPEIIGAVVGALAVIGIPLVAWFARRATREGRLLLRVERLGSVHALMPESPEKSIFEVHLTGALDDLNSWMDLDNVKRRKLIRKINWWTYGIGAVAVLVTLPTIDPTVNPWQASLTGTVIGVAISVVTLGASFVLERSGRKKSAQKAAEREEAVAALRLEALRKGTRAPTTHTLRTESQALQ